MKKPKILIADDEPHSLYAMELLLSQEPYEILFADNGQTTLAQVKTNQPDLIMLDIMMPDMTGYEVCKDLKTNVETQHIPIILVTALNQKEALVLGLNAGADEFLTKPVNGLELRARIRAMLRIKEQHDDLQEALHLREDMANMIVHDMKSPISTILVYADLLDYKNEALIQKKDLTKKIRLQAYRLNSYLGDLLLLAKMKPGQLNLSFVPVNVGELLQKIVNQYQEMAKVKGIGLVLNIPDEVREISIDENLMERVLDNLLSNALKFSPPNTTVTIRLTYPNREVDSDTWPQLRIQVIDQGSGIAEEHRERIFDKYEIIEAHKEDIPQLGLGLALCKIVVDAHDGKIFVQNNEPQGSIFTIEI